MTEKLKTLLHEHAASVDFDAPDLDALVRTGDRQVRRRRGLGVVGGVAAAVVVSALVVPLLGKDAHRDQLAVEPAVPAEVTWVTGSVLHTPNREFDLGHQVRAYVRTSAGFLFSDTRGDVWSFTNGQVAFRGQTSARSPRLVSDDESPLAGWVDGTAEHPYFVVQDLATGQRWRYDAFTPDLGTLADAGNPAYFYGIDDRIAYWRDDRGAVAYDLHSGTATVIDADPRNGFDITDVEDGVFAFTTENGTFVGTSRTDGIDLPQTYGGFGRLSPDARYYSSEGDHPEIFDAGTGEEIRLDLEGRRFATGYEWLDERTVAVLAAERPSMDARAELLTCTVPEGSCEAVAELGTFEEIQSSLALPVGESLAAE